MEKEAAVTVRVGGGPREDYELEVVEAISSGNETIALEAYGDAICNAVDVALECTRRFGLVVGKVEIGKRRRGGKSRIWIRILLERPSKG